MRRRVALVATALALLSAACGGSDRDGKDSTGRDATPAPATRGAPSTTSIASTTTAPPPTTTALPATDPATTVPTPTTTVPVRSTAALAVAGCAGTLTATPGPLLASPVLTEVSGVAASPSGGGTTWVINDSGDVAQLYGIGADASVREVAVTGAGAADWEDLAAGRGPGGEPVLWIADIGDNDATRLFVTIYRVPEPGAGDTSAAAAAIDVRYPDGAHNAEALMADPAGPLLIATKDPGRSRLFAVDPPDGSGSVTARDVGSFTTSGQLTTVVTGASVAPDRGLVAVRTYGAVWLYAVRGGEPLADALARPPCPAPAGDELQGEAVAVRRDATYVTIGEGTTPKLTRFAPP